MNQIQKSNVVQKLIEFVHVRGSQNKAAKAIGISSATVSQMINNKWDLINDEMWRSVAAKVGWKNDNWVGVETRIFKTMTSLLSDAKTNSNVFAITGKAGSGKTYSIKSFAADTPNVYVLSCSEFWNRKFFLCELLSAMGRDTAGLTVHELMVEVVKTLKKTSHPLIVMDEADKLGDRVLYFFITLYNQLEDHCGIVMCATDHLQKRIRRGLKLNKKGYQEIYSRMGRKFIELGDIRGADVQAVCQANGVTGKREITAIFEDSEQDLRRVKRRVHATRSKG